MSEWTKTVGLSKEERISAEIKKLNKLFTKIDTKRKKSVHSRRFQASK